MSAIKSAKYDFVVNYGVDIKDLCKKDITELHKIFNYLNVELIETALIASNGNKYYAYNALLYYTCKDKNRWRRERAVVSIEMQERRQYDSDKTKRDANMIHDGGKDKDTGRDKDGKDGAFSSFLGSMMRVFTDTNTVDSRQQYRDEDGSNVPVAGNTRTGVEDRNMAFANVNTSIRKNVSSENVAVETRMENRRKNSRENVKTTNEVKTKPVVDSNIRRETFQPKPVRQAGTRDLVTIGHAPSKQVKNDVNTHKM